MTAVYLQTSDKTRINQFDKSQEIYCELRHNSLLFLPRRTITQSPCNSTEVLGTTLKILAPPDPYDPTARVAV